MHGCIAFPAAPRRGMVVRRSARRLPRNRAPDWEGSVTPQNSCTAAANGSDVDVIPNNGETPQQRQFWSPDSKTLIIDNVVGDRFGPFGHMIGSTSPMGVIGS